MVRNLPFEMGGGTNNREYVRKRGGVRKKRTCTCEGREFEFYQVWCIRTK